MLAETIKTLYRIVGELEDAYRAQGRKFTLDGHLIGSIGEVIVAEHYGLDLLQNSTKTHDAKTLDGRLVQIKVTQRDRIALSSEPDFLIAIKILPDGSWTEFYNGAGKPVWERVQHQNGKQKSISLAQLKRLADTADGRIDPMA